MNFEKKGKWFKEVEWEIKQELDNVDYDNIKEYYDDIMELRIELEDNGFKFAIGDIYKLWRAYSVLYCASWLGIGDENEYFINMVRNYIKYNKEKDNE